ncbi:hypothetical protein JCM30394_04890 [Deferrisoma palaeochoriense]
MGPGCRGGKSLGGRFSRPSIHRTTHQFRAPVFDSGAGWHGANLWRTRDSEGVRARRLTARNPAENPLRPTAENSCETDPVQPSGMGSRKRAGNPASQRWSWGGWGCNRYRK